MNPSVQALFNGLHRILARHGPPSLAAPWLFMETATCTCTQAAPTMSPRHPSTALAGATGTQYSFSASATDPWAILTYTYNYGDGTGWTTDKLTLIAQTDNTLLPLMRQAALV